MTLSNTITTLGNSIINLVDSKVVNQPITTLTSGTISLSNKQVIYKTTPTTAITFTFNTSSLSLSNSKAYTFELCIVMSTPNSLTFPQSVKWQDDEIPDLSKAGTYFFVFRTIDSGTTWLGYLQGRWS